MARKKKGIRSRAAKFIKETKAELKKVIWPNRKELVSFTSVVLVAVVIAALLIFVIDLTFGQILGLIIG